MLNNRIQYIYICPSIIKEKFKNGIIIKKESKLLKWIRKEY
jgi:hypothetical protein